ncbi:MAG TPA: BglII/BstYI family type II restriction endonuclease [Candidatus Paceibacterota bacterium]
MRYVIEPHRQGDIVLSQGRIRPIYQEVLNVIDSISEDDIITLHQKKHLKAKSLSYAINDLLKRGLKEKGWLAEAPIFQDKDYTDKRWRLDFAKAPISIEVGFNHGEAIAWNLLKPVLASGLNHVDKAIQTEAGILITVTAAMKKAGNFDGAVGEFEKVKRYLTPLWNVLDVPMVVIGLEAPETFTLRDTKVGSKSIGAIVRKTAASKKKRL